MSWAVFKLKMGEKPFIIRGEALVLHGEVWRGAMKGDVYWGLKALENPVAATRLLKRWEVRAPRRFAGFSNTGLDRHFLEFVAPAAAPFVLRFREYVPFELLSALRAAYGGATGKEPEDEEHASAAQLDPSQAALRRGPGRHVPRQDRKPSRSRQDQGSERQVTSRKRKNKRS